MSGISSLANRFNAKINEKIIDPIGRKLDANPLLHKIAVFAAHMFRMLASLALITFLPFSFPVNCLVALGGSVFYRVAIERNCPFHFAIPDCIGGMALSMSLPALVNITGLSTFAMLAETFIRIVPLGAYLGFTVWLSHHEVEERGAKIRALEQAPPPGTGSRRQRSRRPCCL